MKKIIISSLLITTAIFANTSIFKLSEESRIQNYKNIDKKIKQIDLDIDTNKYLKDYSAYIKDNNIEFKQSEILKNEIKELNKDFIYNSHRFNYSIFLKKISYKLPEKEKMILAKEITLEEADYLIFKDILKDRLKYECSVVKEGQEKELKEYLKQGRNIKRFHSKINNCRYDNLTINGKKQFFEKIEKVAFKYLLLEKLYLTRDKSIEQMKKDLEFFKSYEYQETYIIKRKITRALLKKELVKEVIKEELKKVKSKINLKKIKIPEIKNYTLEFSNTDDKNKIDDGKNLDFL